MVCGGGIAWDGQPAVAEGAATVLRDWTGNDSASVTSAMVFFERVGCADRPAVRSRRCWSLQYQRMLGRRSCGVPVSG